MDKKKIDKFREQLEARRDELKKIVARNEQDGREADVANAQDIADRAANSYTKEFLFHQSNSERQMLQLIEGALNRMREGIFGECVNCGNEINPKRLEAVPWTRYCIDCQEKLEKGQLERVT
jgi:DnaK suppressor protein